MLLPWVKDQSGQMDLESGSMMGLGQNRQSLNYKLLLREWVQVLGEGGALQIF